MALSQEWNLKQVTPALKKGMLKKMEKDVYCQER
jgi:hypothetical protein